MIHDTIIVLDFGSQYAQLIARRVREQAVYSELVHWNEPAEKVLAGKQVKGFILSGGPASVYEPGAPTLPAYVLKSGLPVLGICYGMQLLAHNLGGRVAPATAHEYGPAEIDLLEPESPLFAGCKPYEVPERSVVEAANRQCSPFPSPPLRTPHSALRIPSSPSG